MSDPIEEARALLAKATYGAEEWDTSAFPDTIETADRRLFAAAPRLLGTLTAECDRLRAELATLRGDGCAQAQGAHGIAGCGVCIECAKMPSNETRRLRAELAAARELHASFPGSPLASEVIAGQAAKIEAMSAALDKVTAERDDADRRAGAAERRAEEARAALDQACGDEVERAKDAAVLDAWDALRSLAAVDADVQEAQIGPAVDRLIARVRAAEAALAAVTAERDEAASESVRWQSRWVTQLDAAEAAESALAAAREAMPTAEEYDRVFDAFEGEIMEARKSRREWLAPGAAWFDRLDAYRAAHPAPSDDQGVDRG